MPRLSPNTSNGMSQQIGRSQHGRPCSTGHGSGCVEGCCMISMLHRLCLQCDLDTTQIPQHCHTGHFAIGSRISEPSQTLNRYVDAFTNFRLSDGAQWVVDEPELLLDKYFRTRVTSLNLDKLQEKGRLNSRTFMQTNKSIRENTCYNTLPSHQ